MADNRCIVCQKTIPLGEGNLCLLCEENGDFAIPSTADNLNCGTCNQIVEEDCQGLVCDMCNSWYHNQCNKTPLKEALYSLLNEAPNNIKWFCDKCIWETEKRILCFKDVKGSGGTYDKKASNDCIYEPKEPEIKIEVVENDMPFNYSGSNFSDYEEEIEKSKKKRKVKKPSQCKDKDRESSDSEDNKETKKVRKKKTLSGDTYPCSKCEKIFQYKGSFEKHLNKCNHNQVKTYQCKYCEEQFSNKIERSKHQKSHNEYKKTQCSHCGKVLRKDHLKIHETIHTGEKPHQCGYCGRFFSRKDVMIEHEKTHTGEKPHECEYCGKVFARLTNYKTHKRLHTGEKPYQCHQCEKGFNNKSNLNLHLKRHAENKPFQRRKKKSTYLVSASVRTNEDKSSITTLPIFTKHKSTLPEHTSTMSNSSKIVQSIHNPPILSTIVAPKQSHPFNSSSNPISSSHQMPIHMMSNQTPSYPPRPMPLLENSNVSSQCTQPDIKHSIMSPQNASFRDLCNTPTSSLYSTESRQRQAQPLNPDSMHTSYMPPHRLTHSGAESY